MKPGKRKEIHMPTTTAKATLRHLIKSSPPVRHAFRVSVHRLGEQQGIWFPAALGSQLREVFEQQVWCTALHRFPALDALLLDTAKKRLRGLAAKLEGDASWLGCFERRLARRIRQVGLVRSAKLKTAIKTVPEKRADFFREVSKLQGHTGVAAPRYYDADTQEFFVIAAWKTAVKRDEKLRDLFHEVARGQVLGKRVKVCGSKVWLEQFWGFLPLFLLEWYAVSNIARVNTATGQVVATTEYQNVVAEKGVDEAELQFLSFVSYADASEEVARRHDSLYSAPELPTVEVIEEVRDTSVDLDMSTNPHWDLFDMDDAAVKTQLEKGGRRTVLLVDGVPEATTFWNEAPEPKAEPYTWTQLLARLHRASNNVVFAVHGNILKRVTVTGMTLKESVAHVQSMLAGAKPYLYFTNGKRFVQVPVALGDLKGKERTVLELAEVIGGREGFLSGLRQARTILDAVTDTPELAYAPIPVFTDSGVQQAVERIVYGYAEARLPRPETAHSWFDFYHQLEQLRGQDSTLKAFAVEKQGGMVHLRVDTLAALRQAVKEKRTKHVRFMGDSFGFVLEVPHKPMSKLDDLSLRLVEMVDEGNVRWAQSNLPADELAVRFRLGMGFAGNLQKAKALIARVRAGENVDARGADELYTRLLAEVQRMFPPVPEQQRLDFMPPQRTSIVRTGKVIQVGEKKIQHKPVTLNPELARPYPKAVWRVYSEVQQTGPRVQAELDRERTFTAVFDTVVNAYSEFCETKPDGSRYFVDTISAKFANPRYTLKALQLDLAQEIVRIREDLRVTREAQLLDDRLWLRKFEAEDGAVLSADMLTEMEHDFKANTERHFRTLFGTLQQIGKVSAVLAQRLLGYVVTCLPDVATHVSETLTWFRNELALVPIIEAQLDQIAADNVYERLSTEYLAGHVAPNLNAVETLANATRGNAPKGLIGKLAHLRVEYAKVAN
jgi:hypothetical protein